MYDKIHYKLKKKKKKTFKLNLQIHFFYINPIIQKNYKNYFYCLFDMSTNLSLTD